MSAPSNLRHFDAVTWLPRCPSCGEDKLYSLAVPETFMPIWGCHRCGWSPSNPIEFEANAAGQQRDEQRVQGDALALGLGGELGVKVDGHSEADVPAVVAHVLTDGTGYGTLSSTAKSGPAVSHHPGPGNRNEVLMRSTVYVVDLGELGEEPAAFEVEEQAKAYAEARGVMYHDVSVCDAATGARMVGEALDES